MAPSMSGTIRRVQLAFNFAIADAMRCSSFRASIRARPVSAVSPTFSISRDRRFCNKRLIASRSGLVKESEDSRISNVRERNEINLALRGQSACMASQKGHT